MSLTKEEIGKGYDAIVDKIGQDQVFYDRCISLHGEYAGNVLDAGCGRGLLLKRLKGVADPETRFFGIDISSKLCDIARENNPEAHIINGDVENMPYEDGEFDIVFMTETLEHLLDYDKAMSEVKRVLKPGGVLIVTVPNRDWLRYESYAKTRKTFQPVDDHFFTFEEIKGIIERNGFSIEKYIGSDNLLYYEPVHKYERIIASVLPFLHKRMKRVMFKCVKKGP